MTDLFNEYSKYYDLIYGDKDTLAEVEYIDDLLCRYGVSGGRLLEFGSGTGRHARLLSERGYDVHGIEQSAQMLQMCTPKDGCTFEAGDIAFVSTGKTYDAVLSLFHVISYQRSNARLNQVFSNAARHLSSNGLFVFDVWFSPAVLSLKPSVRVKKLTSDDLEVIRIAEPFSNVNHNIVDVRYTIFVRPRGEATYSSFSETHVMRHFSIPELKLFAESNGFSLLCAEEWVTKQAPSVETWGVCMVCKKQ